MEKNTYHFSGLRLNVSPQTRINSQDNTPGFITLDDCIKFCESVGFGYSIYYHPKEGKREKVYPTSCGYT